MDEIAQALQDLQAGRFESAEQHCRRALAAAPGNADALMLIAVGRTQRGLPQDGIEFAARAIAARPGDSRLHFNRAMMLSGLGRAAEALADYAEACRCDPTNLPARINLVHLLLRDDRVDDAEPHVLQALQDQPDSPEALETLGVLRTCQKRGSEAIIAFKRSLELRPGSPRLHANLGWALLIDGKASDAARFLRDAAMTQPQVPDLWANLGAALMASRDWAGALDSFDRALSLAPTHARAIALRAITLDELGRPAERQLLVDFDAFMAERRVVQGPTGYASAAEFHADLAHHARTHPTLVGERFGKTTRKGSQSGDLTGDAARPMATLDTLIRGAIDDHIRALPDRGPFASALRPRRWLLRAWATVLASEGYQDPHHHPSGWISGVYYVAVPKEIRADDPSHAGWIEFGRPDPFFGGAVTPELRLFHPEEGKMLLFPSYIWHRTIPFVSNAPRISIAFDVVPC